jgi:hypothetical protein
MNAIATPPEVTGKIAELNQIVKENPLSIPISILSKFLDCDDDGVRAYLQNSPYPFGMAWQKHGKANRAFKVPTAKFYLWYTNGIVFRKEA